MTTTIIRPILLPLLTAGLLTVASCNKWDDYKKYTETGEITYAGKLDSIRILSGKDRVMITGRFNADPSITQVKVFWNNRRDSAQFTVKRVSGDNQFREIFAAPEGVTTFTVHTYDAKGNKSVPVSVIGRSYGANYRKKLSHRIFNTLFLGTGSTINWEPADASIGTIRTEFQYPLNGVTQEVVTPTATTVNTLPALPNAATVFRFRSIFRPDTTCIDTFALPWKDTTLVPFKNSRIPFIASAKSGRWGNLSDWNANAAVKSHGGFGGWDEWNSNIFNVESGWGSPAINNGKLWQVISLPAGTYTFEISDLRDTNLLPTDNTYLVAAVGADLPDVANIGSALASAKIVNGKPLSELRIRFTLTETKEVSIGYLTTQVDGTPGKFCNIRAFNVYAN
ncbi:DUF4998 domain-containing protein [Paraflavitalea pollutisoli]|uniref:DUF4998 domain-containing protein n=1 Tax=Paraflavitalea pollutisoli TaxID=3034143 RepID=UPI0023ED0649|nr:DUF4998 domain-containing protein [Paraflavitalea sp. H1-2-19X]